MKRAAGFTETQGAALILHPDKVVADQVRVGLAAIEFGCRCTTAATWTVDLRQRLRRRTENAKGHQIRLRAAVLADVALAIGRLEAYEHSWQRRARRRSRWLDARFGDGIGCAGWWRRRRSKVLRQVECLLPLAFRARCILIDHRAVGGRALVCRARHGRQWHQQQQEKKTSHQKSATCSSAAKPSATAPSPTLTIPVMLIGASSKATPHSSQAALSPS